MFRRFRKQDGSDIDGTTDICIPPRDELTGYVKEDDLADLKTARLLDKKILIALSKLEQLSDLQTDAIYSLRSTQKQIINKIERPKKIGKDVLKWILVVVGAGAINTLFRLLVK